MNIVFYTVGCPHCNALEKMLKNKNISYTTIHMDEDEESFNKIEKKGFSNAPVLEVDGKFMGYKDSIIWLRGV